MTRRAVLLVKGFSDWTYTLAPECPSHDEPILSRLAAELHYAQPIPDPVLEPGALGDEGRRALLQKYSIGAPIQRANLGPLTTQYFSELSENKDQDDPSLWIHGFRSQVVREADQTWRNVRMNVSLTGNGRPWVDLQTTGQLSDDRSSSPFSKLKEVLCCSPVKYPQERQWSGRRHGAQHSLERISSKGAFALETKLVRPLAAFTDRLADVVGEVWESCKQAGDARKFAGNWVSPNRLSIPLLTAYTGASFFASAFQSFLSPLICPLHVRVAQYDF